MRPRHRIDSIRIENIDFSSMWSTLKKIWKYLIVHKWMLFFVLFTVVLSSAFGLMGPYLLGYGVDQFIEARDTHGFIFFLMILLGVYVCYSVSMWLQNFMMVRIAQTTVYTMRSNLFLHIQKLPIPYFDHKQSGEVMSRLTNDMDNVSRTLNSSVIQIFSSVLLIVGTVCVMLILSPLLTLITVVIVPLMFLGMKWITKRTRQFFKVQQRNVGELNGFIEETITGLSAVKTFSKEEDMVSEFEEKNRQLRNSAYWAQTYSGFIPKLMNVLNNLSFALIAGAGGFLAVYYPELGISVGMIVTFSEYSRQFTRPLNDLANQFNTMLSAVAGAERVFEVMAENIEEQDEEQALELSAMQGEVQFSNVSFAYDEDGYTIKDADFHVQPGQTVALVGPTGAGKTTIINLLTRFYDADEGVIAIDGHNIKSIKRGNLRSHMAFVLQDSFLFEDSIRENIRFGRLDADDREVEEAARLANAHDFIIRQPQQYETILQQDGSGISQGQKQLLSIARAILANPSILILDEATSSIDTVTEIKIQQALYRLMRDRTCFVIAHRLNTIQQAEQILVIQDGRVIEEGSHDSLLQKKGFYYDLYYSQLTKESG